MIGEFPNRVRTCALLLPPVLDNSAPLLLDACTQFVDPWLARFAQERGYRLIVCDLDAHRDPEPQVPSVVAVNLDKPLPWPDRSFRGVICADTMEHIDHCTGALAEFHRITEPGGFLMLHVPVGIGRPEQMRAKSYRIESDTNEHHHTWEHGTEVADWAQAAGYRMIGGAWSADDSAWRLSCLWLMERP